MYCVKCGKELVNEAAFCPYCGNAVGKMPEPMQVKEIQSKPIEKEAPAKPVEKSTPVNTTKPKKKSKKPAAVIAALLVMVLVIIGVVAVMLGKKDAEPIFIETRNDGEYTYDIYSDHVDILQYHGSSNNVTIPEQVDGIPVVSIKGNAFFACNTLENVHIPESIAYIGPYAFNGTPWIDRLTEEFVIVGDGVLIDYNGPGGDVIIPDSVKYISNAFVSDSSLTSVSIPDSVWGIGEDAFYWCNNLASINIPATVTNIGYRAFVGTLWLDSLSEEYVIVGDGVLIAYNGTSSDGIIPEEVKTISGAFESCDNLVDVTIPGGVTAIEEKSFFLCCNLTNISLADGLTSIGQNAFFGCNNLKTITIPDTVTNIGKFAFSSCTSLMNVNIPEGMVRIEHGTFDTCKSLTSVTIPKNIIKIEKAAFAECSSLNHIEIPESVSVIGCHAFSETPWLESFDDEFIIVGDGVLIDYNGQGGNVAIPKTVKYISDAFENCIMLDSVSIPDSVECVGERAFAYCLYLAKVIFANQVTSIEDDAFTACSSLSSVVFPEGLVRIGDNAFSFCSNLTNVIFSDCIESIGAFAFRDCSSLVHSAAANGRWCGDQRPPCGLKTAG